MTTDKQRAIRIFDSTLRDGEQSPGASMTVLEKLLIASHLEQLGVDVIEAGFPASSPGEFEAVRRVAQTVRNCEVAALCRTRDADIQLAWEAIHNAHLPLLHVFIATSDLHLEHKLKMSREEVLAQVRRAVAACRELCPRVEFSAEDATRSDIGFLKEVYACAVEHGATIVNVPDTVGYALPVEFRAIVQTVVDTLADENVIVSAHCHNDLGLAVANSLAAVDAGAGQLECCVNGIGERAGNAALEEIVMALRVRADLVDCTTGVEPSRIYITSRLVSEITGLAVPSNKAIVGRNAFAHEAGVHQHAVLRDQRTYEIMHPADVGLTHSTIVLGKHSGRAALQDRLCSLGYKLDDQQLTRVFVALKNLADKKKHVYDEDLHALVGNHVFHVAKRYQLEGIEFGGGSAATPWAKVAMRVDGDRRSAEGTGDGPVNAAIQAIKLSAARESVVLAEYRLAAITQGSDAQGRVTLTISEGGVHSQGQATHTDVVEASALAFVNALNQLVVHEEVRKRQVV